MLKNKLVKFLSSCIIFLSLIIALGNAVGANSLAENKTLNFHPNLITDENISPQALAEYESEIHVMNEWLLDSSVDDVITTITFARPLSFEEYESYTDKYEIQIVQLQIRGLSSDGTRTTIMTRTDMGRKETQKLVFEALAECESEFLGVIGMYALINSDQISKAIEDSLTYLADTSNDRFFSIYRASAEADADFKGNSDKFRNYEKGVSLGKMFNNNLAWVLEDLGVNGYNYSTK